MFVITPEAHAAGMAAALIFLMIAWPLAQALSAVRVIFESFWVKLVFVVAVGVAAAPIAEWFSPEARNAAAFVEQTIDRHGPEHLDRIANLLDL